MRNPPTHTKQLEQVSPEKLQYMMSVYKYQWYFYVLAMNNLKNEIKKTVPFMTASKRIYYLGIN